MEAENDAAMGDFQQTKAELNTWHTASTLPYTQDAIPNAGGTGKAEAGDQKLGMSIQTLRRKAEAVTWTHISRDLLHRPTVRWRRNESDRRCFAEGHREGWSWKVAVEED